jgi:hypothetical protein
VRTYGEVIDVRTHRHPGLRAAAAGIDLASTDLDSGDRGDLRGAGSDDAVAALELEPTRPAQFVWRGRLYLVREVLAHWVELGTWWTARGGAAGTSPRRPALDPAAAAPPAGPRSVAVDVGAVEREVWRVEASVGRATTPGVFDLVRDLPARAPGTPVTPDRWRLARALD